MLGLNCGAQSLWSSTQHVGSLVAACELLVVAPLMLSFDHILMGWMGNPQSPEPEAQVVQATSIPALAAAHIPKWKCYMFSIAPNTFFPSAYQGCKLH